MPSGVTRRRLLQSGGLAGAAAIFGGVKVSAADAAALSPDGTPFYLLRSSYTDLKAFDFDVASVRATTLTLKALEDLPAASVDQDLKDSEDAFSLAFAASRPLDQGIYGLNHPQLGEFELFIAPVANGVGYEAVINRSRGATRHNPPPKKGITGPDRAPPGDDPQPRMRAGQGGAGRTQDLIRRVSLRRTGRGVVCEVLLAHPGKTHARVERVDVWITRGDKLKAALSREGVQGRRAALRLPRNLRSGRYDVAVAVTDRRERTTYERATVVL